MHNRNMKHLAQLNLIRQIYKLCYNNSFNNGVWRSLTLLDSRMPGVVIYGTNDQIEVPLPLCSHVPFVVIVVVVFHWGRFRYIYIMGYMPYICFKNNKEDCPKLGNVRGKRT